MQNIFFQHSKSEFQESTEKSKIQFRNEKQMKEQFGKLYEPPRRKPGRRFTAGLELKRVFENASSIRFGLNGLKVAHSITRRAFSPSFKEQYGRFQLVARTLGG